VTEERAAVVVEVNGYPVYEGNSPIEAERHYLWAVENRLPVEWLHKGVILRFSRPARQTVNA